MSTPQGSNQNETTSRRRSKSGASTERAKKKYSESCIFCEAPDDDEEIYGRKVRKCGITVHYFCMLFSSGLSQRGKTEDDGIYGFLPSDIAKEKSRGARLRCIFCRKNGATIGCVVKNCRKVFHFGCGQKAGALNQYFDSYRSFCTSHRPRQTCPVSDRLSFYGTANSMCVICMSAVEARASNDTLRAPCCKNTWFHRKCIQRQALAAGLFFFKCPLCCNKEIFQADMLQVGIYIPEQDAAWEMEPHAYQELLEPYNHCDMDSCLCPQGRKYNRDDSKWEIVVCHWCGSQGSHIGCTSKRSTSASTSGSRQVRWSCKSCALIDGELRKERKKKKVPCSPVSQESSDVPAGKSMSPSGHIGRKLPVKRTSVLQVSPEQQNDDEGSTSLHSENPYDALSAGKPRRIRKRRKSLWQKGVVFRKKKPKTTSATITQAEASLAEAKICNDGEIPLQQVNAENVNPVTADSSRSLGAEAAGPSQSTENLQKSKTKQGSLLGNLSKKSEILLDIKNNKMYDSTPSSHSASKLKRQPLSSSSRYVLRGRKDSDSSRRPLSSYSNRRTLRSDKTPKHLFLSWKESKLRKSSVKSTLPLKKEKMPDGNNNNSSSSLASNLNESFFKSQKSNLSPLCSYLSSPCAPIEINRDVQSVSSSTPAFSMHLADNTINLESEDAKSIEKMVNCDCVDCSGLVVISTDSESEDEDDNSSIISLSLSEPDDKDERLTMMLLGESKNTSALCQLQEQKCDDTHCDCRSFDSWAYPTELFTLNNDTSFGSTASSAYLIESAPGSVSPSPSNSSIITLTSSSDYESCKSSNELTAYTSPFQMQTIL